MVKPAPLPIGYVEVQRGWVKDGNVHTAPRLLQEVWDEMARDRPDLKPAGQRIELTYDGAGVVHYTWYIGFVPRRQTTPPLDPNNLNAAPAPRIGDAAPHLDVPLGMKERKF